MLQYQLLPSQQRAPLSRRATGLVLALAINLLLLLVLLSLGARHAEKPTGSPALVVDLLPHADNRPPPPAATKAPARTPETEALHVPTPKPPPIIIPAKPTIAPPPPSNLLELSNADLAASDIAHMPQAGISAGDSEEVGRGPNGEVLYAAEWARRPTNAELGGYLPANAPDGYGLVACKTIPQNRVDDCIELGQSPLGSHLASAVRQAAWQFRVRPPRRNGRTLVGSWVRIRIDYERG
ncbi:hypothetical protein ACUXST_000668 [Sphingomonas sp. F9_3S_D5_B_2]